MNINNTDNLYILITIIIIIFIYINYSKNDLSDVIELDTILIEINDKLIKANSAHVYNHLNLLKNNLLILNKMQFTTKIENITILALLNLNDYKSSNNFNNSDLELNKYDTGFSILGKQHENHKNIIRSDLDTDNKYSIVEIILNLEIVMLLIKNKELNGKLVLTNLHHLIKLISYDKKFKNLDNLDEMQNLDNLIEVQNIKDDNSYKDEVREQDQGNQEEGNQNNDKLSLLFNCKRDNLIKGKPKLIDDTQFGLSNEASNTKKCQIEYTPFYDIEKIKKEFKKNKDILVDVNTRQSLRNDYNF